ncbi:MAG: diaminopimelate dehydrogenase [Bacillota bacterium]
MPAKRQVAVIGYGNVGQFAVNAIQASPDLQLVGVVRRSGRLPGDQKMLAGVPFVSNLAELSGVEGAVLAIPTRLVLQQAVECLALGINTVDSFDLHGQLLLELREKLDVQAKTHQRVAIVSAGWDPGTDSILRGLMELMAPRGLTFTNFGPGMSMGHTVAVKAIAGVKDALSVTIPLGSGIHRRLVYVELTKEADFLTIKEAILKDGYFANDETHVIQVNRVDDLIDMGHGVLMERKGVSGTTDNQLFKYEMRINNPAVTAQIMVASLRATFRLKPGAYTMLEIPLIDYLPGDRKALLKRLV